MDPAIRPVEKDPVPLVPTARRRREGQGETFDLERELSRRGGRGRIPPSGRPLDHDQAPVAEQLEDEAGSHLDLTA